MSDVAVLMSEPPDPKSGLRKAAEAERRKVDLWEEKLVKAIRDQKASLLRDLTQAEAAIIKATVAPSKRNSKKVRGKMVRRRQPTAVGQKQREGILGLLRNEAREMAMGEIRKDLNIPESSARIAMRHLVETGIVRPVGSGSKTKYFAISAGAEPSNSKRDFGTLQGRVLEAIVERGQASLEELADVVGAPGEEIQRKCGVLIREEEIRMDRVEGHPVYVAAEANNG